MAWNFLQIVEFGAPSNGLYPVPTSRDVGLERTAQDTNPMTSDIAGLKVLRQTGDGPWTPSLNVLRIGGKLVVSDHRIAVTFGKFVPDDRSSFDPVLVVHPDGRTTRRPRLALVGHLPMTQIRQIGVRGRVVPQGRSSRAKRGHDGLGSLIVSATDDTAGPSVGDAHDGRGDHVAIEIILTAETDPVAIGNDVLSRSAMAKVSSPLFSIDQTVRQQWSELIGHGFSPAPGETEHFLLSPYQVVRATQPLAVSSNLIPPTDTSPVPTMRPTPAFPMPSLAEATDDVDGLPEPLVPAPPPPGSSAEWRPDPFRRFELRFWDGFGWTEHVHRNGEQHTDPPR